MLRGRPQESSEGVGQQEGGDAPHEGSAANHRLYPRRMLANRYEKPFPTFFHRSCLEFNFIYVSAGVRGLQLKIAPKDLIEYVGASTADIIVTPKDEELNDEHIW